MTFSQYAGTAIIPTLARIVLGVSFLSLGWCRFSEWIEFPADQVQELQRLNIEVKSMDPAPIDEGESVGFEFGSGRILTTSYLQDQDPQQQPPPDQQEETQPPPEQDPPQEAEGGDEGADQQAAPEEENQTPADDEEGAEAGGEQPIPVDTGKVYTAKRLHRITLKLDARGVKYAGLIAQGVALIEMIGGGLILIGLFSRVWAFGLVCAMGAAFYFTTMGQLTGNPFNWALQENLAHFNHAARHLGFLVLALSVMLAGPGPISLDRLLFKRERPEASDPDLD